MVFLCQIIEYSSPKIVPECWRYASHSLKRKIDHPSWYWFMWYKQNSLKYEALELNDDRIHFLIHFWENYLIKEIQSLSSSFFGDPLQSHIDFSEQSSDKCRALRVKLGYFQMEKNYITFKPFTDNLPLSVGPLQLNSHFLWRHLSKHVGSVK